MKLKIIALVTSVAVLATPAAFGASVFTDPSFESPLVDDGSGVGKWLPFFLSPPLIPTIQTDTPRTGNSYLNLNLAGTGAAFNGVFQDIDVLPNDEIIIDLYHFASNNTPTAIEIRIEWRNSIAGIEVSRTANSTPSPGATYENFSITHTAPAGADTARVVYAAQSFGGSADAIVGVDDFTVSGSTIPEPSGALLISLSALGLLARRKRN